jgi:hypothetical protein
LDFFRSEKNHPSRVEVVSEVRPDPTSYALKFESLYAQFRLPNPYLSIVGFDPGLSRTLRFIVGVCSDQVLTNVGWRTTLEMITSSSGVFVLRSNA